MKSVISLLCQVHPWRSSLSVDLLVAIAGGLSLRALPINAERTCSSESPTVNDIQFGWRWCHKCQGLFYVGNSTSGVCPADAQPHDASQSGKYVMIFGETVAGATAGDDIFAEFNQQGDWRLCSKCQGLFFAGHATHGVCPADRQQHTASGTWHYAMQDEGPQLGWRWCHKCEGLFFGGHASQGVCPHDQRAHDTTGSDVYSVFFDLESPDYQ